MLAVDSLTFYVNLFTYLLEGVTDKRMKLIEKNLNDIKTLLNMIGYIKLKLYLVGHEVSNEVISNLSKTLDSCVPVFSWLGSRKTENVRSGLRERAGIT